MDTVPQTFVLALRYHQAGRLADAEALYRQILAAQPDHPDALHLLGVLVHQAGRHELAVDLIRQAIGLDPRHRAAHFNLGEVYRAMGRNDEAIASYHRALEIKPDSAETYNNLGIALAEQARHDEAITAYRQALQLQPGYAQPYYNLGNVLRDRGQLDEAMSAYRHALQYRPDHALTHNNLGNVLRDRGQIDEAIAAFRRALDLKSDYPEAHYNLGSALREQGRLDEAILAYRRALALQPEYAEASNNLGIALAEQGQMDAAIAAYRQALQFKPDFPEAQYNLGTVLAAWGNLDEAVTAFRRTLRLKPDYPEAVNNLGNALKDLGHFDEAETCYRSAIAPPLNFEHAHFNLGVLLLLLGRYEEGWREYEWRWRSCDSPPPWDGQPAEGKTILIRAEQGFGDTLHFVRYLPLALQHSRASRVILECQPELVPLLRQLQNPKIDIIPRGDSAEDLPYFDLQLPLPSLPLTLGRFAPEPFGTPYLHADQELQAQWRERLSAGEGFRVGLIWRGNPDHKGDRSRSIDAGKLSPILRVPSVRFVSLQVAPRGALPAPLANLGILDFTGEIANFADSAALIAELDLIITVDTAVAHLGGALGRPVWMLLPFVPDWRWGLESETTPWYPTMQLFRQSALGDWDSVIQRVAEDLDRAARVRAAEKQA